MARRGLRVGLIGATGAVGKEILEELEQRRLPVLELRPFASDASEGEEIEFDGETVSVSVPQLKELAICDLIFCAAPNVLAPLLPELRETDACLVDLSGTLELDPAVPLYFSGANVTPGGSREVAIPRGVVAGLALALMPIAREIELTRVTVVCLESASSAGLRAVSELAEHTIEVLNRMTGEHPPSSVFPQSLAFDCLPSVGELDASGETDEEQRLRDVLRRLLHAPQLPIEVTRVITPSFGGSLASVHLGLSHDLPLARARALWEKEPHLRVLDPGELPTARSVLGHDDVAIGRLRRGGEDAPGVAFVLGLNNLRRGAALAAVDAAEAMLP